MGIVQFGVPRDLVLWAKETLGLRTFVETGTNKAETAAWASEHFSRVVTIEGQASLVSAAVTRHAHRKNIKFLQGDSRTLLGPALDELGEPAVLWLDAHWCGEGTFGQTAECPVIEEIAAANRSHADHIVLVDDARFFTGPPPPPHKPNDWPDLLQVAKLLTEGKVPRYATVYQDVIIAVPFPVRDDLVRFIHRSQLALSVAESLRASSLPRRIARRVLSRFRQQGKEKIG